VKELYAFDPWDDSKVEETPILPNDALPRSNMNWIFKYQQHDSLLENNFDECLSEDEKRLAWKISKQNVNAFAAYFDIILTIKKSNTR
jgi:alpha-N-acetylglucosamine transferase